MGSDPGPFGVLLHRFTHLFIYAWVFCQYIFSSTFKKHFMQYHSLLFANQSKNLSLPMRATSHGGIRFELRSRSKKLQELDNYKRFAITLPKS